MSRERQSYIYAGLAVFFWATVPTAFKISLAELDLTLMLFLAVATSALVLLVLVLSTGKGRLLFRQQGREVVASALLGLINPFLYYLILLSAYQLLPAQVAQPLNMIWPIILVFLSGPLLGQHIPSKSYIALLISFAGVYLISSQGKPFQSFDSDTKGVLLATGSSLFWALYFIINMRNKRDEAVKLFSNFLFGTLYLGIALLITDHPGRSLSPKGLAAATYVGLFEMGLTFYFWLKALTLAHTTDRVSNLVYLAPFLSLIFVHFILHESVYYTTPAGLLLIIAGIIIQNRKPVAPTAA